MAGVLTTFVSTAEGLVDLLCDTVCVCVCVCVFGKSS